MRSQTHWRVRRALTVFLTTLLLVGSLIVPAGYLPIGVQPVAAETVVQTLTCDSMGSLGMTELTSADIEVVDTVGGDGTHWLMQNGAGAVLVTDDAVNGSGGCIGLASPYYWSVTAGNWYEIRFLSRTNGTGYGMNFRLGSSMWGSDLVSVTIADSGWAYHSYRFKPTGNAVYPWWYTYRDAIGDHFYLDTIQLVTQPEKLTNNSFETNTSGWSVNLGTLTRVIGGAKSTYYGVELRTSGSGLPATAWQTFTTSVGEYVTVDLWVKNGNADDITVVVQDAGGEHLRQVVTTTTWTNIRYNYRAEGAQGTISVATTGNAYDYAYFDEVFVWSSRDELLAQFDYRSYAMHQLVEAETATRLAARFDTDIDDEYEAARAMISLFLGETWFRFHDNGPISNTATLLNAIAEGNDDLGSNEPQWGNDWQASFEMETLMLGTHWVWGELTPTIKSKAFSTITNELDNYVDGPYADMRTAPTDSDYDAYASGIDPYQYAANLIAWDADYLPSWPAPYLPSMDTRAEDASAWGAAMAYASNVFAAGSGNGYWANRSTTEDTSEDILQIVISDDEDFTLHDSTSLTNLTNVAVGGTKKIANHFYYPNSLYTIAVLKPFTTAQFARKITGQAVPWQYEDDVADRMESDIYQDNWNSTYIQDTGLITTSLTIFTAGAVTETNGIAAQGEVVNRFKCYILPAWFYLYDDIDAMYEAQRTMRLIQDNPTFWPTPVQVVSDGTWTSMSPTDRKHWFNPVYAAAEAYYQYSARYEAMRGLKYGTLPTGNQFVSAPLTW